MMAATSTHVGNLASSTEWHDATARPPGAVSTIKENGASSQHRYYAKSA